MKESIDNVQQSEESNAYDQRIGKMVKSYNSFFENLFRTGLVTKEDIMRVDAEMENEQENKVRVEKERLTRNQFSDDSLLVKMEERLLRMKGSDLIETETIDEDLEGTGEHDVYTVLHFKKVLQGNINGQEVFFETINEGKRILDEETWEGARAKNFLNGKQLDDQEAKRIYDSYSDIAKERTQKIEEMVQKLKSTKNSTDVKKIF